MPPPVQAAPLQQSQPETSRSGPPTYRQPRASAAPFLDFYRRSGATIAAPPPIGYERPRGVAQPGAAAARFPAEDYPPSLMADYRSHGQMLDAFGPFAFERVYQRAPRPEELKQLRRWLAPAYGTTSLSEPLTRFRHHGTAPGDSPDVIHDVESYRRGIYEAMVDIFEEHPAYAAPPQGVPDLPDRDVLAGGLPTLDVRGRETDL